MITKHDMTKVIIPTRSLPNSQFPSTVFLCEMFIITEKLLSSIKITSPLKVTCIFSLFKFMLSINQKKKKIFWKQCTMHHYLSTCQSFVPVSFWTKWMYAYFWQLIVHNVSRISRKFSFYLNQKKYQEMFAVFQDRSVGFYVIHTFQQIRIQ